MVTTLMLLQGRDLEYNYLQCRSRFSFDTIWQIIGHLNFISHIIFCLRRAVTRSISHVHSGGISHNTDKGRKYFQSVSPLTSTLLCQVLSEESCNPQVGWAILMYVIVKTWIVWLYNKLGVIVLQCYYNIDYEMNKSMFIELRDLIPIQIHSDDIYSLSNGISAKVSEVASSSLNDRSNLMACMCFWDIPQHIMHICSYLSMWRGTWLIYHCLIISLRTCNITYIHESASNRFRSVD